MPVFLAFLRCDLENISSLTARTTSSVWTIDVKNGQSDATRLGVTIDAEDEIQLEGSRGTANLVLKFDDAAEKANCTILTEWKKKKIQGPRPMLAEDESWVPFLAFEARGLDVVRVKVSGDNFEATSTSGTTFIPDLSEPDWSDYDDKAGPVSITNLETKVEAVK